MHRRRNIDEDFQKSGAPYANSAHQPDPGREVLQRGLLMDAVKSSKVSVVRYMLQEEHLNPNFIINMQSLICCAVAVGNIVVLELLLDAGADFETPNTADMMWERCPVHIAAANGHLAVLQLLVQRGANINQCDSDHRTPLQWAAVYGQAHMIKWMLEMGAAVNWAQTDGFTALHTASCLGHTEVCRLLIEGGADLTHSDRDGWTPLHTAVCYGYLDVVKLFVEKRADPVQTTISTGDNALHIACSKGKVDIVDLLLSTGVPIECTNEHGSTPLLTAIYHNRLYAAYYLITAGANVNAKTYKGVSALQMTTIRCEPEMMDLLIAAGANVTRGISVSVVRHCKSLASHLEYLASRPQTLTGLCLVVVRQMLAPHLQTKVEHLPVPLAVKRAVAMTDLTITLNDKEHGGNDLRLKLFKSSEVT